MQVPTFIYDIYFSFKGKVSLELILIYDSIFNIVTIVLIILLSYLIFLAFLKSYNLSYNYLHRFIVPTELMEIYEFFKDKKLKGNLYFKNKGHMDKAKEG